MFESPIRVVRPDDLLVIEFSFHNLVRQGARLVKENANSDAYLVAQFQGQSIVEEAFLEYDEEMKDVAATAVLKAESEHDKEKAKNPAQLTKLEPLAKSRLSGPSRLVFQMPDDVSSLPYLLEELLKACAEWPMHLQQLGFKEFVRRPRTDEVPETAIELPYRLFLSPDTTNKLLGRYVWRHKTSLMKTTHFKADYAELWHTQLARMPGILSVSGSKTILSPVKLRAIWSPDYVPLKAENEPAPFTTSLDAVDRDRIVKATARFRKEGTSETYSPSAVDAKRLTLSSLGGWLDCEGSWNKEERAPDNPLEAWTHRATMGRDHYVRVVTAGYLFPFGHAASLVKVTERKFTGPKNDRSAYLFQRYFIVVREPVRTFLGEDQELKRRDFPFTQIEILTRVTPNLEAPGATELGRVMVPAVLFGSKKLKAEKAIEPEKEIFWPRLAGNAGDVLFQIRATDLAGRHLALALPLIFLQEHHNEEDQIKDLVEAYAGARDSRRKVDLNSATVRLAPAITESESGDVDFPIENLKFRAAHPESLPKSGPKFFPAIEEISLVIPTLQRLTDDQNPVRMIFSKHYKDNGLSAKNPGEVYLALAPGEVARTVSFSGGKGDRAGGLATPDLKVRGLSRRFGLVSDDVGEAAPSEKGNGVDALAAGKFNAALFFPLEAKLLGGITLRDVLGATKTDAIPRITTTKFDGGTETRLYVKQDGLKKDGKEIFQPSTSTVLEIDSRIKTFDKGAKSDKDSETSRTAKLNNFKIMFLNCLILSFKTLEIVSIGAQKPSVKINLDDPGVTFGGPLAFLNDLRNIIPATGFSDGAQLVVSPSGITAGYGLEVPNVPAGVFALQNLTLGASVVIPLNGEPLAARFNFAERHRPFSLTLSLFGGGGFLALAADSKGVKEIEAAIEFGAAMALNVGVASGGVYVKGGFYFHFATDQVDFEGYVEMHGELSVIGLISVSLTFHLALEYHKAGVQSQLRGQAKLIVEVEIAFFSKSVEITVERKFAGGADPLFVDYISNDDVWRKYAGAFA